ncbi:MAG TPA: cytochrome c peroxidase [Longimicrobiales bacterium]|nr:cytochrome c peroxidase [Longimicrobiales bacterium]
MAIIRVGLPGVIAVVVAVACAASIAQPGRWSAEEIEAIGSLWLGSLEPLPPDPSNRFADDPAAVAFGHRLFFDTRLSSNGQVSCASCHLPGRDFQDGKPRGTGVGTTDRRTMPIAGTAYSPWQFWDGRKDSQWAQALGPLESPVEHGGDRTQYAHVIAEHYRGEYEAIFGPLPDLSGFPRHAGPVPDPTAREAWERMTPEKREAVNQVFANIGKAIAAYERRIQFGPTRFDSYAEALVRNGRAPEGVLSRDEEAGLRLFVGKANCTNCHNGPLLTNNDFHNIGVPIAPGLAPDRGRTLGAPQVLSDEFNCRSRYSDARPEECSALEFMVAEGDALEGAFKTPSLRGVADRAPYMHAGQFATLGEVLRHYNDAPAAAVGHTELERLRLSDRELAQLEAYLRTLSGPIAADPELLAPPVRQ